MISTRRFKRLHWLTLSNCQRKWIPSRKTFTKNFEFMQFYCNGKTSVPVSDMLQMILVFKELGWLYWNRWWIGTFSSLEIVADHTQEHHFVDLSCSYNFTTSNEMHTQLKTRAAKFVPQQKLDIAMCNRRIMFLFN